MSYLPSVERISHNGELLTLNESVLLNVLARSQGKPMSWETALGAAESEEVPFVRSLEAITHVIRRLFSLGLVELGGSEHLTTFSLSTRGRQLLGVWAPPSHERSTPRQRLSHLAAQ